MKILRDTGKKLEQKLRALDRRAQPDPAVQETVSEIIRAIAGRGDAALIEYTKKFGGPRLTAKTLQVLPSEIAGAQAGLPKEVERALRDSRANVRAFARRSLRKSWFRKNREGAVVGERFDAFERVGLYIPGGSAPLVSSAVMTATLAQAAGVREIVAVTPANPDGTVHPALLAALSYCGATEIYRVGGAQAVAALAHGTQTIRPVQKIFGPGNAWVVEAKRQLFGLAGVDLLPGPSEVLVIADESANPAWVAADLLAQCEHGHGSIGILLTTSDSLLEAVAEEIHEQTGKSLRKAALQNALKKTVLALVPTLGHAVRVANGFAAEHVSIATSAPGNVAASLTTSGAIFLGGISPVAAGDFLAGPSHELPTGGAGKSFSGLTADQFQRRTSVIRYDRSSLEKSLQTIDVFSRIEGLDAHGRSVAVRLAEPVQSSRKKKSGKGK